jgi:hypothetical protein
LIPTLIRQVLSTIQKHQVQALLMGGQACVFYGTAQFSKDVNFLILAKEENFEGPQARDGRIPPRRASIFVVELWRDCLLPSAAQAAFLAGSIKNPT